jgi:NAD(P)-dependent dehydrogenase (short-subunit alcohol dehydrogenase family)
MPQLTWFITGCSSGFGSAFVSAIVARGDRVIATARKAEDIVQFAGENVHTLELDVTAAQAKLDEKMGKALEVWGELMFWSTMRDISRAHRWSRRGNCSIVPRLVNNGWEMRSEPFLTYLRQQRGAFHQSV